jgi:hypothetical protein
VRLQRLPQILELHFESTVDDAVGRFEDAAAILDSLIRPDFESTITKPCERGTTGSHELLVM